MSKESSSVTPSIAIVGGKCAFGVWWYRFFDAVGISVNSVIPVVTAGRSDVR